MTDYNTAQIDAMARTTAETEKPAADEMNLFYASFHTLVNEFVRSDASPKAVRQVKYCGIMHLLASHMLQWSVEELVQSPPTQPTAHRSPSPPTPTPYLSASTSEQQQPHQRPKYVNRRQNRQNSRAAKSAFKAAAAAPP